MGGGIFTYTALVTAATMVQESEKGTRHIVLFADAADAEEPGDYQRLLETLTPLGITVSVIGLGSETDSDAEFLKDVAARGQGRIHFTADVEDLPRLFAQEAITVGAIELHHRADRGADAARHGAARRAARVAVSRRRRLQPHVSAAWCDDGRGHDRRLQGAGAGLLASRPRAHRVADRRSGRQVLAAAERVAADFRDLPSASAAGCSAASRRRARRPRSNARAARPSSASISIRPRARRRRRRAHRDARRSSRPAISRRRVAAPRSGVGRRRHARSTVSRCRKPGMYLGRRRLGTGAVLPLAPLTLAVLAGVRAADRSEGRTQDAEPRSRASPAASSARRGMTCSTRAGCAPSDPRPRDSAGAAGAAAARGGDRRTAIAAVRGGARLAANDQAAALVKMDGETDAGAGVRAGRGIDRRDARRSPARSATKAGHAEAGHVRAIAGQSQIARPPFAVTGEGGACPP